MSTHSSRAQFDAFLKKVLQDPEAREAFEDAQSRSFLVDALVRMRRRLDLTQTAVAKRIKVGQPTVSGFENEGSDPRLSTIQRYARAVDATFVWDVCPNSSLRADFYFRESANVKLDVNRNEPSARALSWTPHNAYSLAA